MKHKAQEILAAGAVVVTLIAVPLLVWWYEAAEILRAHLADRLPTARAFTMPTPGKIVGMFRADL